MNRQVAELAAAQHGVVTRAQLISAGVGGAAVDSRVRRGALLVVHRGVYAVGHAALRDEGFWLAAVLASGPGAVLSHLSAALLWGMRVRRGPPIHLTATRRSGPAGVVVHETRNLSRADITVERGIRVTTPARTVIDCADTVTYEELRILADHGVRLDAGPSAEPSNALRSGAAPRTSLVSWETTSEPAPRSSAAWANSAATPASPRR
jgi:predicted transcriptional regulator of viral defense system